MKYIILVSIVTLVLGRPENGYRYQLQSVSTKDRDTVPCCQRLAQLQKNSLSQGTYSNLRTTNAEVSSENYQSLPKKVIVQRPSSQGYPSSAVRSGYYAQQSASETNGATSEQNKGYISSSGAVSAASIPSVKSTSGLESSSTQSGINTAASTGNYPSNYVSQSASNGYSSSTSSQVRASSANGYDPSASASYTPSNLNGPYSSSYTSSYPYGNDEPVGSASSGSYSATSLRGQSSTDQFSPANHKALIQKHIYVHVPPQDNEDAIMRAKYEALMTPKKHYKIIFIKTPTPPNFPTAQLIANAGQQEEKTLVYVLVRKPEEPTVADIRAAQAGIQPNKPEVYFIKYKTKEAPASLGEENLYSNTVANDGYAYNSNSFSNNGISITTESSYSGYPPSPSQSA